MRVKIGEAIYDSRHHLLLGLSVLENNLSNNAGWHLFRGMM